MDPEIQMTSDAEVPELEVEHVIEGPGTDVRSSSSSNSIFRAPKHIRYGRESDFTPKVVSIGPYHHGRKNLQPMEDKKVQCMSDLLKKRPDGVSKIDQVPVDPFMKFVTRARSFYKNKFPKITNVEFVEMLVRDSCFIIRIMLSFFNVMRMGFLEVNMKDVRSDLLLLDNQIPLFFIYEVYNWLFPNKPNTEIREVVEHFICKCLDLPWTSSENYWLDFESNHLLEFYWKSLACKIPITARILLKKHGRFSPAGPNWTDHRGVTKLIANATELHRTAGIQFYTYGFQIKNTGHDLVEFSKGIMWMHCLNIDSSMATLLVNLIAFEHSMFPYVRIISTYIKVMDDLTDSEKDVELLQKFGIIYNTLDSHTKAVTFLNDIGNLCLIDYNDIPFSNSLRDVKNYYDSIWNRSLVSLKNGYFNSLRTATSVFAGVILLILSVLQTYYTIYAYYKPWK